MIYKFPIPISTRLFYRLILSLCFMIIIIFVNSYSSYINIELLKSISENKYPSKTYWIIWFTLQLLGTYNFVPRVIDYLTFDEISWQTCIKFKKDIEKCSADNIYLSASELHSIYGKLCMIRFIPAKLGWCLESINTIINASIIVWQINGYWIWIIITIGFISSIIDEYIHSKAKRKQFNNEYFEKQKILNRTFAYIPEGNSTNVFDWLIFFHSNEKNLRMIDNQINEFYNRKNIIPSFASLLINALILINFQSDIDNPSIILISLINLSSLIRGTYYFITNLNRIRNDLSKCADYEDEISKLYRKNTEPMFSPFDALKTLDNITQVSGESGKGKTIMFNKIVDNIGNEVVYLSQLDTSNFSKMSPLDAVLFMQRKQNKKIAIRALQLACLNKSYDDILEKPSGGEHQKLRIARSIYQYLTLNRKIWIIDEPDNNIHPGTNFLETNGFLQIMENIFSIIDDQTRLIFTTHKGFVLNKLKDSHKIKVIQLEYFINLFYHDINKN